MFARLQESLKNEVKIKPTADKLFNNFGLCCFNDVLVCLVCPEPILGYRESLVMQEISKLIEWEVFSDTLHICLSDNIDFLVKQGFFVLPCNFTIPTSNRWQIITIECLKHLNDSMNSILFIYHKDCEVIVKESITNERHKTHVLGEGCLVQAKKHLKEEYNLEVIWNEP